MNNKNEWSPLSELLSHLIAKYADELDIDAMPKPDISLEEADAVGVLKKTTAATIAKGRIA